MPKTALTRARIGPDLDDEDGEVLPRMKTPSSARKLRESSSASSHGLEHREGTAPPLASPPPGGSGPDAFEKAFPVLWVSFQLLVWAWAAVWWDPRFLEFVGGREVAHWLQRHLWFRLLFVPILAPLLLLSVFQPRKGSGRRLTPSRLQDPEGAAPIDSPDIDLAYGFPEDDALRVPLGPWVMRIGTWARENKWRTVARVEVDALSSFSFLARASRREPSPLRGLQQAAMNLAMRRLAETKRGTSAAGAAETMAYLGEEPLSIGDDALDRAVVLRASHPGTARTLFKADPVARALEALEEKGWGWEWTLYPTSGPGRSELTLECPGSMRQDNRLGLVRALMSSALEHLASTGEIRPPPAELDAASSS